MGRHVDADNVHGGETLVFYVGFSFHVFREDTMQILAIQSMFGS